jgi:hypothetical protein
MEKRDLWRWGQAGVLLQRDTEDGCEHVWLNDGLPAPHERARYGMRVEVLCWFASIAAANAGLVVLHDYFHADSVLALMRRRDDATRILLYTAAAEPVVQERYLGVRAVLRPTAIGLRVAFDPMWDSFSSLADLGGVAEQREAIRA